ncbi:hypothetical protein CAPTEDRAFT_185864 [Capitella teleta]|uniref:Uncharacterized protein n=1 Tax=Capitella teleta TaxID=283909 RepID=R7TD60_CAPTE|nr:hypothetical protein CAPTEDRAFT_185864 [Capitella teleta]|eukprot:ELT91664.1 hypothetical protein CAPTEDRAFT_185864 [Capitella teleta]
MNTQERIKPACFRRPTNITELLTELCKLEAIIKKTTLHSPIENFKDVETMQVAEKEQLVEVNRELCRINAEANLQIENERLNIRALQRKIEEENREKAKSESNRRTDEIKIKAQLDFLHRRQDDNERLLHSLHQIIKQKDDITIKILRLTEVKQCSKVNEMANQKLLMELETQIEVMKDDRIRQRIQHMEENQQLQAAEEAVNNRLKIMLEAKEEEAMELDLEGRRQLILSTAEINELKSEIQQLKGGARIFRMANLLILSVDERSQRELTYTQEYEKIKAKLEVENIELLRATIGHLDHLIESREETLEVIIRLGNG